MAFFLGGGVGPLDHPDDRDHRGRVRRRLALGTLDTELFPTEVRGTSNGFLLVCGVVGSAVGLLRGDQLKRRVGGLGTAHRALRRSRR